MTENSLIKTSSIVVTSPMLVPGVVQSEIQFLLNYRLFSVIVFHMEIFFFNHQNYLEKTIVPKE